MKNPLVIVVSLFLCLLHTTGLCFATHGQNLETKNYKLETVSYTVNYSPLGLEGGLNLYAYGSGNPLAYIDPLGLFDWDYSMSLVSASWQGFVEGFSNGLEIGLNTMTFGLTDYLEITQSHEHQGSEYEVSRAFAKVGTTALTLAVGAGAVGANVAGGKLVIEGAKISTVGLGTVAGNAATQIATDPNKLHHVFDKAGHSITPLLNSFGGNQGQAYHAIANAAQNAVTANNLTGVFDSMKNPLVVKVGEHIVHVGGAVVDGVFRVGTAYIKQ